MTVETIPISTQRVRREEPFTIHVSDLVAWPRQDLLVHFEYNRYADRWVFEIENERTGVIVPRSMATLGTKYKVRPYAMFQFKDPTGEADRIRTSNLGDRVKLCIYPGALGGSFLPEAGISQAEEDRILRRDWWSPVG